uniref:Uncharacterized protein n=1 Tax=Ascaris lumbricoides TaxID=6252 RepID=A0A0M3I5G8_ASCLU
MDGGDMQDKTSKASIDRFASLGNSARRPTSIVSLRDDLTTVVIFGTPPEAHSLNHHLREPAQYKCCQVYRGNGCWTLCVDMAKLCAFVVVCLLLIFVVECIVYLIYLLCFRLPSVEAATLSERLSTILVLVFKQLYFDITT